MATVTTLPTWDEQIAALPEDALYEEIDGIIVEKPTGAYELKLANVLAKLMVPFVEANGLGQVLVEMFFNLRPAARRSPRPDVAFLSAGALAARSPRPENRRSGPSCRIFAVEIVSPTQLRHGDGTEGRRITSGPASSASGSSIPTRSAGSTPTIRLHLGADLDPR